jgi:hypothetical protein
VAAVAVWDHKPSADEMLDARVARGWEPTPTGLKDGAQVLGYAAVLGARRRPSANPSEPAMSTHQDRSPTRP